MSETTLENLASEVRKHSALYYEGNPEISDPEFDRLLEQYLEAGGEEQVGHGYTPTNREVTHDTPMGSLKKVKDDPEALNTWLNDVAKFYEENGNKDYPLLFSVSPKFDGLALSVTVQNGKVQLAATRGDGTVGENVTQTALNVPSIQALTERGDGEYRGEIMLPAENLEKANNRREKGATPLTQIRNAASGIIRKLDDQYKAAETLVFTDHSTGDYVKTYTLDQLKEELPNILLSYEERQGIFEVADEQHVGIDGVVFKVENPDVRDGMSESSGSPRWARAYKFSDEVYESRVTGVQWRNPGKIGRITPVITYDTIHIAGGEYTQATAHNRTQFLSHDPHVGDHVTMKKAGDVIPYIIGVTASEDRGERLQLTDTCPSCGTEVVVDGEFLVCPAPRFECDPVLGLTIIISGLGIKGIRESLVQKVYDAFLINSETLHDALDTMRTLPEGWIASLDGLGEKSEEYVRSSLNEAWNTTPLWAWLYGLNITRVGESVSKALEATYGSVQSILDAIDDPQNHYKEARHLTGVNWEHIKQARDKFEHLRDWFASVGVTVPEQDNTVVHDEYWSGQKVALTGSLDVPRSQAEAWLESRGAIPQKSFSKSTDILIDAGDGTSTKSRRAKTQGTTVVTGQEFMEQYAE